MRKWFPEMYDRPEMRQVIATITYWAFAFVILPVLSRVMIWGMYNRLNVLVWTEIVFCLLSLPGILILCRGYLQDSYLNVTLDKKGFFQTVAIATGLILVWGFLPLLSGYPIELCPALAAMPVSHSSLMIQPAMVVLQNPLFGTLCMVFVAPLLTSCLYYTVGFSPICVHRPVLAYVVGVLVASLPRLAGFLTMTMYDNELPVIIMQIPVHLIACWSYQKADTVWAPIVTHASANLIICICIMVLKATGIVYIR